ncbi:MAG: F0F1 ATP synthase subunit A, partial [Mycobacteriales bacterium]
AAASSAAVLGRAVEGSAEGGKHTFESPGPNDFDFPGLFSHDGWFTKPILIVMLMTVVCFVFYYASSRNPRIVPGRLQFAGESLYGFIRNDVALDAIGHHGLKFAPYLATLFSFVALNNIAGIIPFLQIPATSHIAFPLVLAIFSWAIFMYLGIKRHGAWGYFRDMMFPPGIPFAVYFLLAPIEFFSTVIVRPVTLMLRLTFNMFAGHLVLVLFIVGGEFLVKDYGNAAVGIPAGAVSLLGSIILTGFEAFVQLLQAYVFTLLTALYIGGALADEH